MPFLPTNPQNHTDGGSLELDGASSITSADVGGFTYVFVAGGVDDGISVFRLLANGTLTPVTDVTDGGALELDGARGLSTAMVDGNTYLFVAGQDDDGVSVFRVNTNGSLTSVSNVTDDATMLLDGVSDTATTRVGASTYLYTAGTLENGISIFRVAGDGRLTFLANTADGGGLELAGARALTTVVIGATSYLIAAGGVDDGISVFSINAATGALTNTDNEDDGANASYRLNGASDVTTAVIGSTTYVFVTGVDDNGVTVFSLNSSGVLTFVDNELDSGTTLIAGANSVSVHSVGTASYLLVGGSENGLSVYRIENGSNNGYPAGSLTWLDNIADSGSRELEGVVATGSANIGGTTYILGAGQTDDGISAFGSTTTGQLYFLGNGDPADTRLAYVNNDGGNQTSFVDNGPTQDLITTFPQEIGVDTAAGFYFGLVNGGNDGSGAQLVRGSLSGGAATVLVNYFGPDGVFGDPDGGGPLFEDDTIVNALHVDTINERIYVGLQDALGSSPSLSGIREYSYNPLTGAITDLGWFINAATDATKPSPGGGFVDVFDVRDFDIDFTTNTLYFTELLTGNGGGNTQGLYRMNMTTKAVTLMTSTANVVGGFPSGQTNPADFTRGYIIDVEVDSSTNLVYFSTQSQQPFGNAGYNAGQNAIWFLPEGASGATATQLTLVGLPGGHHIYPGDMVFDQVTRQLYVESEETDDTVGADTDDVIYVFDLDSAGTTATLVNTISLTPGFTSTAANLAGMHFNQIAALAGISGTASAIGEQGGAVQLLTGAPTITDADGDHLSSATVQITGGLFSSNESNATDDRLFFGPTLTASGNVGGTSITWAYNSATNTLTFTGYDTVDNYEIALAGVRFQSLGDNPTNYGLNTTRTITWTVSDGALGVPGGSQNSATTAITITAVNDAPVNTVGTTLNLGEDAIDIVFPGMSITDPDANPGITDVTVTFTVVSGTIEIRTDVAGGIEAGDITAGASGSATITVTATLNQINATLVASSGLTYTPNANFNGADTLTVVTNDGGNTGTGGALSDSDVRTINISAVNDAPTVIDATQAAATILEDTPSNLGQTVSALFTASFSDALDQQQTGGNPTGSAANTLAGIAVVGGSTSASGSWEYFNGATWVPIGAASTASAVLVSAGTAVRFNPALNFNGSPPDLVVHLVDSSGAAITNGATVNLTGATGGTTRYSSTTVALSESVTAVNDAPVNTVGGTLTVAEDSAATNVTGISISDVEANPATDVFTVTLDVLHGTLNVSIVVPGGVTAASGNGTDTIILSGTINQINATLAAAGGLTYTPTGNYNGSDRVQVTTDDGGATGLDPGATGSATSEADIDSKTINVTAVNDPVTGTAPATLTVAEDATNVAVTGLSISDVDAALAPAGVYEVTLSATNGTLTLTTLAGLTFSGGSDGTADATMTFHGTLAAINTALATALYTPAADYNGVATITLNVTDTFGGIVATGTGLATSDSDNINVTVTAVNDGVDVNAPGTLILPEDSTNIAVTGLSIADVDATLAPAGVYDVTLATTNGTLTLTTLTGLTFTTGTGTGEATMTFHGTLADINTALATARYTPTANYNGAATITLSATDTFGGIVATGTGPATADSANVNVTVTAVNDPPVVAVQASVSSTEQVAGTIDAAATIADVELGALNNYGGSSLTVGRNGAPAAEDLISFGASGAFTVNGANLEAGGLVFATFAGGNGSNLVISFTSSGTPATQALVDAVVQSLQYTYTGNEPPASIVIDYTFNDGAPTNAGQGTGGSPTGTDSIIVTIINTPENSPPVVDLNTGAAGENDTNIFAEDGGPSGIGVAIGITDVEGDAITRATVTITDPSAGDLLSVLLPLPPGISVDPSSTATTLILIGSATASAYASALGQVSYANTGDDPTAGGTNPNRIITVTATDAFGTGPAATMTMSVFGTNDQPTLIATGGTPAFTEGGSAVDLFGGVAASTVEANQTFTSLTLTVSNVTDGPSEILGIDGSTLALTNGNSVVTAGNGLTVSVTLAAGTATVTFSGASLSQAALQTLIDGLTYRNSSEIPTDADRVVTITELVDSGSNVAPNDNTTALGLVATVNVNPVNDAPQNVVPGTQTINEDGSVTLTTISVSDVDASTLTVTLSVAHGTLTIASTLGLSFSGGSDGTNDTSMTFSGTAAAINAALGAGLTYNPNANFNGSDAIIVNTTDELGADTTSFASLSIASLASADVGQRSTPTFADYNGDGRIDLIVGNASGPTSISVFQRQADGSFVQQTGAANPFNGINFGNLAATAFTDFTGDGNIDALIAHDNGAYRAFAGNGSGGFTELLGGANPFGAISGDFDATPAFTDFDGDGDQDLVIGRFGGDFRAFQNNGDVFTELTGAANPFDGLSVGNHAKPAFVDIDRDGDLDLVAGRLDGTFAVFQNNGVGLPYTALTGTANPLNGIDVGSFSAPAFADLNGDGLPDLVSGEVDGTLVIRRGVAGTEVTINITAINDAPVVIGDGTEQAADINEDVPGPGQTIQALFAGQYSDAADNQIPNGGASSPGQFSGVAVIANGSSPATGQWQYFNGAIWVDIGSVSTAAAKLFGDPFVTLFRFNPTLNFTGNAPTLTVLLIDNSLGFGIVNNQVVDLSGPGATGGTTAYSSDTVVLGQYIIPDNLPPIVDLNGPGGGIDYSTTFVEDGAAVAIGSGIVVAEQDAIPNGNLVGATVTLTDRVAGDSLVLSTPLPLGFSAIFTSNATTITIEISGAGTPAQYQAILSSIVYATTNQDPTVGGTDPARTVTVTVDDGQSDSAVATTTITITPIDDLPLAQPDAFTINENGSISGGNLFASNGSGADTDPDGPPLAISAVNGSGANVGTQIVLGSGALLTVNANGTFDYDPNGAFLLTPTLGSGASNTPGHDQFTYTLASGNTVTVSITLTGLDTNDLLLGTAGADVLMGGAGNDTYLVDGTNDQVIEAAGQGSDAIYAAADYMLGAGQEVEMLSAYGQEGTSPLMLAGNAFAQTIIGNAGANFLIGGGGADIFYGLLGNDTYLVDSADDVVFEYAGQGTDVVYSSVDYALAADQEVEELSAYGREAASALTLTGNALAQTIIGNAGANFLIGGGGADIFYGLLGNDTYLVDSADDVVLEYAGQGTDAVYSSVSYALAAGQEVEVLSVYGQEGTDALSLTGNSFAQTLIGNAGNNFLSGGGGTDIFYGLGGNDTYLVDSADDLVIEYAGQGNDSVYTSASYALVAGQEIELLLAADFSSTSPINLTGNELANTIYGNAGANVLDGKGGNDLLVGQAGADTYAFTTALGIGNIDVVLGFDHGVDKIALDDAVFAGIGALGALDANAFVIGSQAADASDRIIYNSLTGQLFFDADGSGVGAAVQFATMSPGLALSASDFVVI